MTIDDIPTPEPQATTSDNAPWVAFYSAMLAAVDPSKPKDAPPPPPPESP